MGESYTPFTSEFNRSVRAESRPGRLTGDGGAVIIREIIHRLVLDRWLTSRLRDAGTGRAASVWCATARRRRSARNGSAA